MWFIFFVFPLYYQNIIYVNKIIFIVNSITVLPIYLFMKHMQCARMNWIRILKIPYLLENWTRCTMPLCAMVEVPCKIKEQDSCFAKKQRDRTAQHQLQLVWYIIVTWSSGPIWTQSSTFMTRNTHILSCGFPICHCHRISSLLAAYHSLEEHKICCLGRWWVLSHW